MGGVAAPSSHVWHDLYGDLPAVIVVTMHMAPVVPECPAVCTQLRAITPEGRPAVLPDPIVITLDVAPIAPNVLAILMDLAPVMTHALVHLPAVLSTRARDPQCHSH